MDTETTTPGPNVMPLVLLGLILGLLFLGAENDDAGDGTDAAGAQDTDAGGATGRRVVRKRVVRTETGATAAVAAGSGNADGGGEGGGGSTTETGTTGE